MKRSKVSEEQNVYAPSGKPSLAPRLAICAHNTASMSKPFSTRFFYHRPLQKPPPIHLSEISPCQAKPRSTASPTFTPGFGPGSEW